MNFPNQTYNSGLRNSGTSASARRHQPIITHNHRTYQNNMHQNQSHFAFDTQSHIFTTNRHLQSNKIPIEGNHMAIGMNQSKFGGTFPSWSTTQNNHLQQQQHVMNPPLQLSQTNISPFISQHTAFPGQEHQFQYQNQIIQPSQNNSHTPPLPSKVLPPPPPPLPITDASGRNIGSYSPLPPPPLPPCTPKSPQEPDETHQKIQNLETTNDQMKNPQEVKARPQITNAMAELSSLRWSKVSQEQKSNQVNSSGYHNSKKMKVQNQKHPHKKAMMKKRKGLVKLESELMSKYERQGENDKKIVSNSFSPDTVKSSRTIVTMPGGLSIKDCNSHTQSDMHSYWNRASVHVPTTHETSTTILQEASQNSSCKKNTVQLFDHSEPDEEMDISDDDNDSDGSGGDDVGYVRVSSQERFISKTADSNTASMNLLHNQDSTEKRIISKTSDTNSASTNLPNDQDPTEKNILPNHHPKDPVLETKSVKTLQEKTLSSTQSELAEKKLRLAMALKKAKLQKAKARLLQAQMKKEQVLKANNSKLKLAAKNKIGDITAFKMKTLLVKVVKTSEYAPQTHDTKLEPITDATITPEVNNNIKEQDTLNTTSSERKEKQSLGDAEKLKLSLELAKRKLKLKKTLLLNAKAKKEVKSIQENACSNEEPLYQETSDSQNTMINEKSLSPSTSKQMTESKNLAAELRKKQISLRESIELSKETNRELKDDKEIRELKELIEKQRRLLQSHGAKISTCNQNLQECADELIKTKELRSTSDARLEELLKRKAMIEKMISSVSQKVFDARRKKRRREKKKLKQELTTEQG